MELLTKYQKQLLAFANTDYGKTFLIDKWGGKIEKNDKVIKITPNGFHLLKDIMENKAIIQATFFCGTPYLYKFSEILTYLDIWSQDQNINKINDEFIRQLGSYIYLNQNTYNAIAAGDGQVQNNVPSSDWATTHDDTDGSGANASNTTLEIVGSTVGGSSNYIIIRGFLPYDTSSLGQDSSIIAATFSLYVISKRNDDNDGDDWLNIVQTNQTSPTALATTDFDNCGSVSNPTEGATRVDIGNITTSAYNDWVLNSTGRGWIDKDTVNNTLLGVREGHDAINSAFVNSNNTGNAISINTSDNVSNKPRLVVDYSKGAAFLFMMN